MRAKGTGLEDLTSTGTHPRPLENTSFKFQGKRAKIEGWGSSALYWSEVLRGTVWSWGETSICQKELENSESVTSFLEGIVCNKMCNKMTCLDVTNC